MHCNFKLINYDLLYLDIISIKKLLLINNHVHNYIFEYHLYLIFFQFIYLSYLFKLFICYYLSF